MIQKSDYNFNLMPHSPDRPAANCGEFRTQPVEGRIRKLDPVRAGPDSDGRGKPGIRIPAGP